MKNGCGSRNIKTVVNEDYLFQQKIISEVCENLGLVAYKPDYHGDSRDCNTVIIYTKEGHEYNEKNNPAYVAEEQGRICSLENTDINGIFDMDYMCRGKIKCHTLHFKENLYRYIKNFL